MQLRIGGIVKNRYWIRDAAGVKLSRRYTLKPSLGSAVLSATVNVTVLVSAEMTCGGSADRIGRRAAGCMVALGLQVRLSGGAVVVIVNAEPVELTLPVLETVTVVVPAEARSLFRDRQ